MNPNWKKKMNAIPVQRKGPSDRITAQEWNQIINILSEQANNNTEGSSKFMKLLEEIESGRLSKEIVFKIIGGFEGDIEKFIENLIYKLDLIINIQRVQIETDLPEVGSERALYIVKFRKDLDENGLEVLKPFNAVFAFDSESGYYQTDGEKGGILVFHNDEMFPMMGNGSNLYLAKYRRNLDDEFEDYNMLFRFDEEEKLYIPVAGQGSGGTGGGVLEMVRLKHVSLATQYIMLGEDKTLEFSFLSSSQDPVSFSFFRNESIIKVESGKLPGIHIWNISDLIYPGTNNLKIVATTALGTTTQIVFVINGVNVTIGSAFNDSEIYTSSIVFPYTLQTQQGVTMRYARFRVNGGSWVEKSINQVNNFEIFDSSMFNHGSHIIEYQGKVIIEGVEIFSNILRFSAIFAEQGNNTTIISSRFNTEETTEGDLVVVDYLVYKSDSEFNNVSFMIDDTLVAEVNSDRNKKFWNIRNLTPGTKILKIQSGSVEKTFTIEVSELDITLNNTDDVYLKTYLKASGKTNQDIYRESWLNSGINGQTYPFIMSNFNFASNGWIEESLVFNGIAEAELQYKPFGNEVGLLGRTIEIEFETNETIDDSKNVIECIYNNRGFEIKPNKATFKGSNNRVDVYFKEGQKIRISFVVNRVIGIISTFIDGVYSGVDSITNETLFSQGSNASNIKFNLNKTGMKLYNFRVYDRALTHQEILDNYIFDANSVAEKAKHFNGSLIYDINGNIDIEKIKERIPVCIVTLNNRELPTDRADRPYVEQLEFYDPFRPGRNFIRNNVRIRTQGSSSQQYPIKNFRLYSGSLDSEPVIIDETARPAKRINLKADFMESSMSTDPALANWIEAMYDEKMPPQITHEGVRTTIGAGPCILFHNKNGNLIFQGIYNYNNDKSDHRSYGHEIGSYQSFRFEVLFNATNNAVAFVRASGITDEEFLEQMYQGFELRYPGDYPDNTTPDMYMPLYEMIEWISEVTLNEATIESFKSEFEKRFSKEFALKYILTIFIFGLIDNFGKDLLLNTWLTNEAGIDYPEEVVFKGMFKGESALDSLPESGQNIGDGYLVNGMLYVYTNSISSTNMYGNTYPAVRGFQNVGYIKWWVTLYDMDTAIGIDNFSRYVDENGNLRYDYNIELDDTQVFAQAESKLWDLLMEAYKEEISQIYRDMRPSHASYENIMYYIYENQIDRISKAMYNENAIFKYLPHLSWAHMLKGDRWQQIQRWISLRLAFLDSKYISGTEAYKIATRYNIPANSGFHLDIIPTIHQWITVQFGNLKQNIQQSRANAGEMVTLSNPVDESSGFPFFETTIYGAQYINEVPNLNEFNLLELDISQAIRLKKLMLGKDVNPPLLTSLVLGNNTQLEEVDLRNISSLQQPISANGLINLKKFDASGSGITGVALPDGGVLEELKLPQSVTSLSLINQKYLNDENFELHASAQLEYLRIIDTINVDFLSILSKTKNDCAVRITGLKLTVSGNETLDDLVSLKQGKMGIKSDGTVDEESGAIITGDVTVFAGLDFNLNYYKNELPGLNITLSILDPSFTASLLTDGTYGITSYSGSGNTTIVPAFYASELEGKSHVVGDVNLIPVTEIIWDIFTNSNVGNIYIPSTVSVVDANAFAAGFSRKVFTDAETKPSGWEFSGIELVLNEPMWQLSDGMLFKVVNEKAILIESFLSEDYMEIKESYAGYNVDSIENDLFWKYKPKRALYIPQSVLYISTEGLKSVGIAKVLTSHTEKPLGWETEKTIIYGSNSTKKVYNTYIFESSSWVLKDTFEWYGLIVRPNVRSFELYDTETMDGAVLSFPFIGSGDPINLYAVEPYNPVVYEFMSGVDPYYRLVSLNIPANAQPGSITIYIGETYNDGVNGEHPVKYDNSTPKTSTLNRIPDAMNLGISGTSFISPSHTFTQAQEAIGYIYLGDIGYGGVRTEFCRGLPELKTFESNMEHFHMGGVTASKTEHFNSFLFDSCRKLESVIIRKPKFTHSNTWGACHFKYCSSLTYLEMELDTNYTYIPTGAFLSTKLTHLDFSKAGSTLELSKSGGPSNEYGDQFSSMSELVEIKGLQNITSISKSTFYNTPKLKSVDFLFENLTHIAANAFDASGFEEIDIYDFTKIGNISQSIFMNMKSLKTVNWHRTIPLNGQRMFKGCSELENFNFIGDGRLYNGDLSASEYNDETFMDCIKLENIDFSKIDKIGEEGFKNSGISGTVTLNPGVNQPSAFENTKVTKVIVPNTIDNIELAIFRYCSLLSELEVAEGVLSFGPDSFRETNIAQIIIPSSITTISANAFSALKQPYTVQIASGSNLSTIENSAFEGATNSRMLQSINLEMATQLQTIGGSVFKYASINEITIPGGVTSMGAFAFDNCLNLASVTIQEGVTSIGLYSFRYCSSLTSITIPSTITSIGNLAFFNCTSLAEIIVLATTPPTIDHGSTLDGHVPNRPIKVPVGTVAAYQAATNWSEYAADIVENV